MKRYIEQKLAEWKISKNRKPLILKGARQVGKTYALHEFAKKYYPAYHYFNFEKMPKISSLFDESLDPKDIIQGLSLHQKKQINPETELIIFDEIQACPNALTSLKYFCEDMPQIHVCAAGSLLGVYLGPVSFPVGKVNHLEMHPMSFQEFLLARGDNIYVELLQNLKLGSHIPQIAHEHLWTALKHYFITGGLPEVVNIYCKHQEHLVDAFERVREKQIDLIEDYFADIAKHSGQIDAMHINRIWRNVPEQLTKEQNGSARKFKFKDVLPGIDRYNKLADALDWLEAAGLILKSKIVNKAAIPLSAYTKENAFKLFMFDIGLLGAMSELHPSTILDYDYGSYKGFFAENYVAQAFTFASNDGLYCWTEGQSEIEFLRLLNSNIIPVEVKSGWITQAKSLKVYFDKYHPPYTLTLSAKPLRQAEQRLYWPLYLAEQFASLF